MLKGPLKALPSFSKWAYHKTWATEIIWGSTEDKVKKGLVLKAKLDKNIGTDINELVIYLSLLLLSNIFTRQ